MLPHTSSPVNSIDLPHAGQLQRVAKTKPSSGNGFWNKTASQMAVGRRSGGPSRKVTTMMPVSVPKVLVRPPGQRQSEWVDLWEAYVSQRAAWEYGLHCMGAPFTELHECMGSVSLCVEACVNRIDMMAIIWLPWCIAILVGMSFCVGNQPLS